VALSVGPASARPGERLRVTWSGVPAPNAHDWIGLYSLDRPERGSTAWRYVGCGVAPTDARADGSCQLDVPATAEPGRYEVRFFAEDVFETLGSASVTIAAPAVAPDPTAGRRQQTDLEA
jgi:hypothetical protein